MTTDENMRTNCYRTLSEAKIKKFSKKKEQKVKKLPSRILISSILDDDGNNQGGLAPWRVGVPGWVQPPPTLALALRKYLFNSRAYSFQMLFSALSGS